MTDALAKLATADKMLAEATDITELMDLRSLGKAAEAAAVALGLADIAQRAKVFQLRAERKAGEWLDVHVQQGRPSEPLQAGRVLLSDIELDATTSSRWKALAHIPEEKFHHFIDEHIARGWEVTAGGLRAYARNLNGHEPTERSGRMPQGYWLKPPVGACALAGFRIPCSGRLTGQHIVNKSKARGNEEVRAILVACPDEVMAQVCEGHNVGRFADAKEAQRILLLQKVYVFGYAHMRDFLASLPWKVPQPDLTLEALLG